MEFTAENCELNRNRSQEQWRLSESGKSQLGKWAPEPAKLGGCPSHVACPDWGSSCQRTSAVSLCAFNFSFVNPQAFPPPYFPYKACFPTTIFSPGKSWALSHEYSQLEIPDDLWCYPPSDAFSPQRYLRRGSFFFLDKIFPQIEFTAISALPRARHARVLPVDFAPIASFLMVYLRDFQPRKTHRQLTRHGHSSPAHTRLSCTESHQVCHENATIAYTDNVSIFFLHRAFV